MNLPPAYDAIMAPPAYDAIMAPPPYTEIPPSYEEKHDITRLPSFDEYAPYNSTPLPSFSVQPDVKITRHKERYFDEKLAEFSYIADQARKYGYSSARVGYLTNYVGKYEYFNNPAVVPIIEDLLFHIHQHRPSLKKLNYFVPKKLDHTQEIEVSKIFNKEQLLKDPRFHSYSGVYGAQAQDKTLMELLSYPKSYNSW
jgi:hypothetical protein